MPDYISIASLFIALISLIVSGLSFWLNYIESKPRLVFSYSHISCWGDNDVILYSILKNPGNKSIEITDVEALLFQGKKQWQRNIYYRDSVHIEKHSTYKLEMVLDKNLWKEKYANLSKIEITIETVFGKFKKTFRRKKPPFNKCEWRFV
jgi:hypothetical protein